VYVKGFKETRTPVVLSHLQFFPRFNLQFRTLFYWIRRKEFFWIRKKIFRILFGRRGALNANSTRVITSNVMQLQKKEIFQHNTQVS
jgi:hypothetical protein